MAALCYKSTLPDCVVKTGQIKGESHLIIVFPASCKRNHHFIAGKEGNIVKVIIHLSCIPGLLREDTDRIGILKVLGKRLGIEGC